MQSVTSSEQKEIAYQVIRSQILSPLELHSLEWWKELRRVSLVLVVKCLHEISVHRKLLNLQQQKKMMMEVVVHQTTFQRNHCSSLDWLREIEGQAGVEFEEVEQSFCLQLYLVAPVVVV